MVTVTEMGSGTETLRVNELLQLDGQELENGDEMNNEQSSKFQFSFKQTCVESAWVYPKHIYISRLLPRYMGTLFSLSVNSLWPLVHLGQ